VSEAGYAPQVGVVVRMMDLVRSRTLNAVEGLSIAQLDHLHDPQSNSIGALLAHIAAVESLHAILSFDNRLPTPEEFGSHAAAFVLGDDARRDIKGKPLDHYLERLSAVRESTKRRLREKPDAWLFEERSYPDGIQINNFYAWFHVPEDETNHRGQINWLRKRLPA
jgi:uncharacterized damage-inducible protein DinB